MAGKGNDSCNLIKCAHPEAGARVQLCVTLFSTCSGSPRTTPPSSDTPCTMELPSQASTYCFPMYPRKGHTKRASKCLNTGHLAKTQAQAPSCVTSSRFLLPAMFPTVVPGKTLKADFKLNIMAISHRPPLSTAILEPLADPTQVCVRG